MDSSKVDLLKKAGLFTKGFVYLLIGALAAVAAAGMGGKKTDQSGISSFLKEQPFGTALLILVCVGLFAYSFWRFYQVIFDPRADDGKTRVGVRFQYAYSGIFYSALGYSFAKAALSMQRSDGKEKKYLAQLLEWGYGVYVVYALAAVIAGQAIFQFYLGISGKHMVLLDEDVEKGKERTLIHRIGLLGYCARGLVFFIIAYFLVRVGLDYNAGAYEGTKGVFKYLESLQFGSILLFITAGGIALYGLFNIFLVRHVNISRMG